MKTLQYNYYRKGVIYSGDHYKRTKLNPSEAKSIMNKYNAWYLRNIYDFDTDEETNYYHIIQDRFYDIDELPSKSTRKNLRKSLSMYTYKLATKEEMHTYGFQVEREGCKRIGKKLEYTEEEFHQYVDQTYADGNEFWLGFSKETSEPAMLEYITIMSDHVIESAERLSYKYTKHNPTYGLNYLLTKHYLIDKGYKYIDAGAVSLTEHSNVQDFLIDKFCFRRAYCRVQIYMNPLLKAFITTLKPFKFLFQSSDRFKGLFQLYNMLD